MPHFVNFFGGKFGILFKVNHDHYSFLSLALAITSPALPSVNSPTQSPVLHKCSILFLRLSTSKCEGTGVRN